LAVARHLPHGRSPGGDRHLNFYGNRDNLMVTDEIQYLNLAMLDCFLGPIRALTALFVAPWP
jgi:hypothetical protein